MDQPPNSPTKCFKLLFVDDEDELRELISDFSQNLRLEVITAATAEEAARLFQAQDFDVIFTDISMPRMTGIDLLTTVRATKPEMPFIFWSGFWDEKDLRICRELPNVQCLEKPAEMSTIRNAIENIRKLPSRS